MTSAWGCIEHVLQHLAEERDVMQVGVFGSIAGESSLDLVKALEMHIHITHLNLLGTQLSFEGCRRLAFLLPVCPVLTTIDLGCNELGPPAAAVFADVLHRCSLLTLNLSSNNMGDDGVTHLCRALKKSPRLTSLALAKNNLSDASARCCGETLQCNTVLLRLYLNSNQITDVGAEHLAEGLRKNGVLATLALSFNELTTKGLQSLDLAIDRNRSLTSLKVARCLSEDKDDDFALVLSHIDENCRKNLKTPLVLSVRGSLSEAGTLWLSCTTISGNVVAHFPIPEGKDDSIPNLTAAIMESLDESFEAPTRHICLVLADGTSLRDVSTLDELLTRLLQGQ